MYDKIRIKIRISIYLSKPTTITHLTWFKRKTTGSVKLNDRSVVPLLLQRGKKGGRQRRKKRATLTIRNYEIRCVIVFY
jgi:hypothetical protein